MAPRWLRNTGRIVAWPVMAPVEALSRRAGRAAVTGALEAMTDAVATPVTATREGDPPMPSKSLFKSKTFWFNVLTAAAEVSGALVGVIPPGTLTLIVNGINVGLRVLSDKPVHVTAPKP